MTKFFDLWDNLKQLAGGTDSLYTVCGGRTEVLDIADKEGDLSQEFLDIMKEHRHPDLLEEAVKIQAALTTDTVPRMVSEYCSSYDSARAQVLAIEAASLAHLRILQEINKAATAQVEQVRDENMRKLLEEESQGQPTAAAKARKRSKKSKKGKSKEMEVCCNVQSDHNHTTPAEDGTMVLDGSAHKDAASSSDLGDASTLQPVDNAMQGDGNAGSLLTENAVVALLKKCSAGKSCADNKPSTSDRGVRQHFQDGSRAQKLYNGLGGGLAIEDFLKQLCCPITEDIMQDAVIASDGVSYERSAIEAWYQQSTDPMLSLLSRQVLPNRSLQDIIDHFRAE
ncbi:probable WD repeat, SAM and U-box domain-containing protein 1 at C-terminar half [Coccomyxa sp. Obi]|nr:probable WD repeat, SAM and U-box domain-containing protein 1 at C-terminar half [Coccomyxa sp. Obi]